MCIFLVDATVGMLYWHSTEDVKDFLPKTMQGQGRGGESGGRLVTMLRERSYLTIKSFKCFEYQHQRTKTGSVYKLRLEDLNRRSFLMFL